MQIRAVADRIAAVVRRAQSLAVRIDAAARRHPAWSSVGTGIMAVGLAVLVLDPTYDVNDDPTMAMIADGSLTGDPSPHLIFSNVALGALIAGLETITPALPWYGIYLLTVHALVIGIVAFIALSDRRPQRHIRSLALLAFVVAAEVPLIARLQFTSASLMLGFAGLGLFLTAGIERNWRVAAFAGAVTGVTALMRWESFWAVLLVASPLLLIAVRQRAWRQWAGFGAGIAVVVLGSLSATGLAYSGNQAWEEYHEFNAARGSVQGTIRAYSPALRDPALLEQIGWTTTDMQLFQRFFFPDPDIFTLEDVQALESATDGTSRALDKGYRRVFTISTTRWLWLLTAASTLVLILRHRWRGPLLPALAAGAAVALALFLHATVKLPYRVMVPLVAWPALISIAAPRSIVGDARPGARSDRVAVVVVGVAAFLVLAASVPSNLGFAGTNRERDRDIGLMLESLRTSLPDDSIVVEWPGALGLERASPFRDLGTGSVQMIYLGWYTFSPGYDHLLHRAAIDDLPVAIAERDDVFLVVSATDEENIPRFLGFLREHYGFVGAMREVSGAGGPELAVYDRALAFHIETDGTLIQEGPSGRLSQYLRADELVRAQVSAVGPVISGSAVDTRTGEPPDQVILMSGGDTLAILKPAADGSFTIPVTGGTIDPELYATIESQAALLPIGSSG